MDTFWYWNRAGHTFGPLSPAVVRRMAAAGVLAPDDPVATDPRGGWVPAGAAAVAPAFAPADRPDAPDGRVGCPGCGARLSADAPACPGCGHPQPVAGWAAAGKRVARCVYCLATNAVATAGGEYEVGSCRGCGRALPACHPQEYHERDLDGHFRAAAWVGAAAGAVAAAVAFAAVAGVLDRALGWVTDAGAAGWAAVAAGGLAALAAGYTVVAAARRRYGDWLRGRPGAPEFTPRDWWEADFRYDTYRGARRQARLAARGAGRSAAPGWAKAAAAAAVLAGGWWAYRAEFGDYARGRKAGIAHVREVNRTGAFLRAGMTVANALDLVPTDPQASPDWNAGFRDGFHEEIARMYPRRGK